MRVGRVRLRALLVAALCLSGGAFCGYWLHDICARPRLPTFRDVVERCQAAVVGIRCLAAATVQPAAREGSGFVFHPAGLILTNAHLVADRMLVMVDLAERGRAVAEVVSEDPVTDLAVLRLTEPLDAPLATLAFGDSDRVSAGDWVLALGRPMTLGHTVTAGLVSARGRHLPLDDARISASYLQFSAAVSPGSSGSPVLDLEGRVVGMTAGKCRDGEGLAFAVPSRVIQWVLGRMEQHDGQVPRGYLGVSLAPGRARGRGALVTKVEADGPAWLAGIRAGDVVLRYAGDVVEDAEGLYDKITQSMPAAKVVIEVRGPAMTGSRQLVAVLGVAHSRRDAPAVERDPQQRAGA